MPEEKQENQAETAKGSIEENFLRLEQITTEMEQENVTLEDSFRLFQEGMKLIKQCGDQLEDVEKKMIVLEEDVPR